MAQRARELYPNRNAGLVAIAAVRAAASLPFQAGLEYETQRVNECKQSDESKGAVHAFFAERETRRIPGLSKDATSREIKSAGIVGAGTMGGGIAICFANAGIPVTLLDADPRSFAARDLEYRTDVSVHGRSRTPERARQAATARSDSRLACVRGSRRSRRDHRGRVRGHGAEAQHLRHARSRGEAGRSPGDQYLDARHRASSRRRRRRPQDVIGMHFFSPANVMPLLEVVRTDWTSPSTIRTVMDLAKPLRKTPVLARSATASSATA